MAEVEFSLSERLDAYVRHYFFMAGNYNFYFFFRERGWATSLLPAPAQPPR